jgi:dihydrofolate reductase
MPENTNRDLIMVVASTPAGTIGSGGGMPWRLATDLKRFKSITHGGTLIMGRKTFDSIGRVLPGRTTIVVTRDKTWCHPGVYSANSITDTLQKLHSTGRKGFVVGGSSVYEVFRTIVAEIWLTKVWSQAIGDTHVALASDDFALVECMRISKAKEDSAPTELQRWVRQIISHKSTITH